MSSRWRLFGNAKLVIAVVWLFLPSILVAAAGTDTKELRHGVASWFIATLVFVLLFSLAKRFVGRIPWLILLSAYAVYTLLCVVLAWYQYKFGLPLDVGFVLSSPANSLRTFLVEARVIGTIIVVGLLCAILVAYGASMSVAARQAVLDTKSWWAGTAMLLALMPAMFYVGGPHSLLLPEYALNPRQFEIRIPSIVPDYSAFDLSGAHESVVITQLESVNALAVNGELVADGRAYPGNYLPGTTQLRSRGVFFPHFWNHGVFTHHGQQAILCGVVQHFPMGFYQPTQSSPPCLPELFRRAGYKTVFLSSYPEGGFFNTDRFMSRIGFEDVRFADFMQPQDQRAVWGYAEKTFFQRAYAYLNRRYKPEEKLFVYFALCAHHAGFSRDIDHDHVWFTAPPQTQVEQYLASAKIQDASLVDLYKLNEEFARRRPTHLIVVPDHSYPMGLYGSRMAQVGASIDNFLTTFFYIPPDGRMPEFAVGSTVEQLYGQADIIPTVAELVTHRARPNSFVPAMKRDAERRTDYEPCQVMTQLFGGGYLYVAHGMTAFQYNVQKHTVTQYALQLHPMRQRQLAVRRNVLYKDFESQYGCQRYQRAAAPARAELQQNAQARLLQ